MLFLLISSLSFAQDFKERREKVKALKVAFITEKLELTTEEAQKFWPIYNVFDDNQSELRHEKMRAILNRFRPGNVDKLSEKEASVLLVQIEKIEEDLFNLRKKLIMSAACSILLITPFLSSTAVKERTFLFVQEFLESEI
jgi:hypothetical protein